MKCESDAMDFLKFTFGSESKLNLLGKIVFAPLILYAFCLFWIIEKIFTVR